MNHWRETFKQISPQQSLQDLSCRLVCERFRHLCDLNDRWQCLSPFGELTWQAYVSKLHEPVMVRNPYFCRSLACSIIDDQGKVDRSQLAHSIEGLTRYRYCLDPLEPYETRARGHALTILKCLMADESLTETLLAIRLPLDNPHAQSLVRDTLALSSQVVLTDSHARQACLCVLLSYFRQNVGSCFATAPGIIVQTNHPLQLLQDLQALFNTGKLERYFDGTGLEVPLSRSVGISDYKKPIPLDDDVQKTLWRFCHSPALMASLHAAGLLTNQSTEQRVEKMVAWLTPLSKKHAVENSARVLSVEQLLKWIAMRANGVDEQDLQRHALRPEPIIRDGMLVQIPFAQDKKHGACEAYFRAFNQMEKTFKRFGENPLLKAWEYTLASLTDHTSGFTKSNLYYSLGVDPQQAYGIGQIIQVSIQALLDQCSRQIAKQSRDHELLAMREYEFRQRLRTSDGPSRHYLQMEYDQLIRELREIEQSVQDKNDQAHYLSGLFQRLLNRYLEWFSEYFQEIYDPDLHQEADTGYADAPAGFRLFFKPARTQSSQWQAIRNEQQFVQALQEFFRVTEVTLMAEEDKRVQAVLRDLVTRIVQQVQDPEFMTLAQRRLLDSRRGRSQLGQSCMPWAYISGGSVETLLDAYLRKGGLSHKWEQSPKNPHQLFEFIVSCLRHLHADGDVGKTTVVLNDLVICSPTHAFTLKPYCTPFQNCWQSTVSALTWLEKHAVMSARSFYDNIVLDEPMQQHLFAVLMEQATGQADVAKRFPLSVTAMSPALFRQKILSAWKQGGLQRYLADAVDSLLYCQLPLIPADQVVAQGVKLMAHIGLQSTDLESILVAQLSKLKPQPYWGAKALQTLLLNALLIDRQCLFAEEDWQQRIADAARELGLAPPKPIIFADSNWFGWEFAFVYNPGCGQLDIWQCDYLGRHAQPLSLDKWGGAWQILVNDFLKAQFCPTGSDGMERI